MQWHDNRTEELTMGLFRRTPPPPPPPAPPAGELVPSRFNLDQLMEQVNWLGQAYPLGLQTTMGARDEEAPDTSFAGMVESAYRTGGPVFACILNRAMLFSEARFQYQAMERGRPGALFGTPDLSILENPWPNGTTRELLWRAEQDASIGGNFYLRKHRGRLWRLRPDWMTIVLGSQTDAEDPMMAIDAEVAGFIWGAPGGRKVALLPEEVAHWSPIPDPLAAYRGMSWLTPVMREVGADHASVTHKSAFFKNAATPNLVVLPDSTVSYDEFKAFKEDFQDQHEGSWNAYKTLFLGGGSKVERIGLDFKSMDFKGLQGISETRIAAAALVPPIIAGFSEGLASATYSNYGMARRKFGDHFARPQWGSFAAAIAKLVPKPSGGARLWYDDRHIAMLREDMADEAKIRQTDAATISVLISAGYKPDAAVAFVQAGNLSALVGQHTGLTSVQLLPAGTGDDDAEDQDDPDEAADDDEEPGDDDMAAA